MIQRRNYKIVLSESTPSSYSLNFVDLYRKRICTQSSDAQNQRKWTVSATCCVPVLKPLDVGSMMIGLRAYNARTRAIE